MKHRSVLALYGYWNELRAGRLAPQRLEIEPSCIAGILSETFMLERMEGGSYQFRLAGTRLCELLGSELRGQDFLDGWSADDRGVLERHLRSICDRGAVLTLTFEGIGGLDGRHRAEFEAVMLPLAHSGRRIARIIGAIGAMSAPYWLASEPMGSRRLLRHELIWPDGRPHAVVERLTQAALPARSEARIVRTEQRQFRVFQGGLAGGKGDKR
jgi:hypothetical protein